MTFAPLPTARLARCSAEQLEYWARHGVVTPGADGTYSFRDLVAVDRIVADVEADVDGFDRDRQSFVDELRAADAPTGSS